MPTLISEAERRFLGAMLADRDLEPENTLNAEEFGEPEHGAVYAAILRSRSEADLGGAELSARVAELADTPGIDQDFLEELRTHAPEDRHQVVVYAEMIGTAAMVRETAALTEPGAIGDALESRGHAALLRHSLSHLALFDTEIGTVGSEPLPEPSERAAVEEQLVAALIAEPGQVKRLVGICPPESFEDYRARSAYEIVANGAWSGNLVSDLDLIYQLGQGRLMAENTGEEPQPYTESDAAFVRRISEMPTAPNDGMEAAGALLSMDVRNSITPHEVPGPEIELPPPSMGFGPEPPTPRPGLGGGF